MSKNHLLALFFFLLFICVGMIVASDFSGPTVREKLLPVAVDGFKTVLGAIIGVLSALMGVKKDV